MMSLIKPLTVTTSPADHDLTVVKTEILQKLLSLSESILEGRYSERIVTDFDDDIITKIVDNINRFCDRVQLDPTGITDLHQQDETVSIFIEVISSFTNRDFKQKLPISENGTIMDAIATGINVLGEELEYSTASKKDLELERNRLDEAQAIAKIGSWELSAPTLHLEWSKESYRIFEADENSSDDLYKTLLHKIKLEDSSRVDSELRGAIERGENFSIEYSIWCRDGSIKNILCIGEVVNDVGGRALRWKGTLQDITERKTVEEKLRQAKEQAEEASKAKSRFLANMSHEIRTPLNGILGLTEIMMCEEISKEHREYLKLINTSGKNLTKLINDILDFTKIESGNLLMENIRFSFREVITACILPYKFLAKEKGIGLLYEVDSAIPPELIGDPTRISQIITNLIGNAIKFTEQGKVEIVFSLLGIQHDEIRIQGIVQDTGVGIPQDAEDKIFKSFSQADETVKRKYGGTGLGLNIVKNLIQQMHGTITVQSCVEPLIDHGTTFTFMMKLKCVPGRINDSIIDNIVTEKPALTKPLHILIVDDNQIHLLVAKKMVRKFCAEVTTAESGAEAINLVKENHYDMVFMDIQMPDMNGYEAAAELRTLSYTQPIIALSANAYEQDVQNSLDAGMNGHLQKPYTEDQLYRKLKEFEDVK